MRVAPHCRSYRAEYSILWQLIQFFLQNQCMMEQPYEHIKGTFSKKLKLVRRDYSEAGFNAAVKPSAFLFCVLNVKL